MNRYYKKADFINNYLKHNGCSGYALQFFWFIVKCNGSGILPMRIS